MKKALLSILLLIFTLNNSFSEDKEDLNKVPENFRGECYEYYKKISNLKLPEIYKVDLNKTKNLVITQNGFILAYKYFSKIGQSYDYKNNLGLENKYFLDYNYKTFNEINSKTQNEIILTFNQKLIKGSFDVVFNYSSNHYKTIFFIGDSLEILNEVSKNNIADFSFKYLKIKFIPKNESRKLLENIRIYELNFPKKGNTILLKSEFDSEIEIYSTYNCKNKLFSTRHKIQDHFSIDKNTKTIKINLERNPKYNVHLKKDFDNDLIENDYDNCINIYNPFQKDKDGDGRGDLCSDDDKDGIIGEKDNCIYIYNPTQKDININGIGDKCEFDKDKDGIFDRLDNCINSSNPEQKDEDNDGIGDLCDNCKYYNPRQVDKDSNSVGDICDEKEKNLKENDKDGDGVIDWKDNCKEIANPKQDDDDEDGVGNICDNCKNIKNNDQLDFDKNGLGDICEDSDNDGIKGLTDNCINIPNPKQEDDDNNGVGNLCEDKDGDKIFFINDNCPYKYNPNQEDIDSDGVGDVCDKEDNRFIESNKWFFVGIILLFVFVFLTGIIFMFRKLK